MMGKELFADFGRSQSTFERMSVVEHGGGVGGLRHSTILNSFLPLLAFGHFKMAGAYHRTQQSAA